MQARTVIGVKLKSTEPHGYEFQVGEFDYHVRKGGRLWVLDQFRSSVVDPDEAYVRSIECESLTDGVLHAIEELGPSVA